MKVHWSFTNNRLQLKLIQENRMEKHFLRMMENFNAFSVEIEHNANGYFQPFDEADRAVVNLYVKEEAPAPTQPEPPQAA